MTYKKTVHAPLMAKFIDPTDDEEGSRLLWRAVLPELFVLGRQAMQLPRLPVLLSSLADWRTGS